MTKSYRESNSTTSIRTGASSTVRFTHQRFLMIILFSSYQSRSSCRNFHHEFSQQSWHNFSMNFWISSTKVSKKLFMAQIISIHAIMLKDLHPNSLSYFLFRFNTFLLLWEWLKFPLTRNQRRSYSPIALQIIFAELLQKIMNERFLQLLQF